MKNALFVLSLITLFALAAAAPSCQVNAATGTAGNVPITITFSELATDFTGVAVDCGTGTKVTATFADCKGTLRSATCTKTCSYLSANAYTLKATVNSEALTNTAGPQSLGCTQATATISATGAATNPAPTTAPQTTAENTAATPALTAAQTMVQAVSVGTIQALRVNALPVVLTAVSSFGRTNTIQAAGVASLECLQLLQSQKTANAFDSSTGTITLTTMARTLCTSNGVDYKPKPVLVDAGEFVSAAGDLQLFEVSHLVSPTPLTTDKLGVSQECLAKCGTSALTIADGLSQNIEISVTDSCLKDCANAGIRITAAALVSPQLLAVQTVVSQAFTNTLQTVESGGKTTIVAPSTIEIVQGTQVTLKPDSDTVTMNGALVTDTQGNAPTVTMPTTTFTFTGTPDAEKTDLTFTTTSQTVIISETNNPSLTPITTTNEVTVTSGGTVLTNSMTGASGLLTVTPLDVITAAKQEGGLTSVDSIKAEVTLTAYDTVKTPTTYDTVKTTITATGTQAGSILGIIPVEVPATYTMIQYTPVNVVPVTYNAPAATTEISAVPTTYAVATPTPTVSVEAANKQLVAATPATNVVAAPPVKAVATTVPLTTTSSVDKPIWSALVVTTNQVTATGTPTPTTNAKAA